MTAAHALRPEVLTTGLDSFLVRFALTPEPAAMTAARRLAYALEEAAPDGVCEIAARSSPKGEREITNTSS